VDGVLVECNSVEYEKHRGPVSPRTVTITHIKPTYLLMRGKWTNILGFPLLSACFLYLLASDSNICVSAYKSGFINESHIAKNLPRRSATQRARIINSHLPTSAIGSPSRRGYLGSLQLHSVRKGDKIEDATCYETAPTDTTVHDISEKSPLEVSDEADDEMYQSAIKQTAAWVIAAGAFGACLIFFYDPKAGEEFYAGYLVEQSLSVDNLFVFLLLFDYFKVPIQYQNKVLNWGICGAVVMRAVMISVGAVALYEYRGVLLLFAGFLVYSSVTMLIGLIGDNDDDEETDMSDDGIVKFSKKLFNSVDYFDGDNFFTMKDGIKVATPLFLCMVALEISDVVFAVDSVPAVFGVTENPLIVWSSNMFAILGLRSLYTILSKAAADLKYLEPAVALVLGFIGSKMIAEYFGNELPTIYSLVVVATLLGGGIILSIYEKNQESVEDVIIDVEENEN